MIGGVSGVDFKNCYIVVYGFFVVGNYFFGL